MCAKQSPGKITLAMMKGKSIATSVPTIHYHASDDELEELYPSSDEEKPRPPSRAPESERLSPKVPSSPSRLACDRRAEEGEISESNSDRRPIGTIDGSVSEGTPPSSDPWKVLSEIKGKITKTFEEKLSEMKSDKRKRIRQRNKENSSLSDFEDLTGDATPMNENVVTEGTAADVHKQTDVIPSFVKRKSRSTRFAGASRSKFTTLGTRYTHSEDDSVESAVEAVEFGEDHRREDQIDYRPSPPLSPSPSPSPSPSAESRSVTDAERRERCFGTSVGTKNGNKRRTVDADDTTHSFKHKGFEALLSRLKKELLRQLGYPLLALCTVAFGVYHFLPLPEFVHGFVLGILLTLSVANAIKKVARILRTFEPDKGEMQGAALKMISVLEVPAAEEHSVVERYEGWLNELPYAYDPDNYHVARTKSVYFRLEGEILHVMETRTRVPKRAIWDEPRHKMRFTKKRVYDLTAARVDLLPAGLIRRRRWSKKYPICVTMEKDALIEIVPLKDTSDGETELFDGESDETVVKDDNELCPRNDENRSRRRTWYRKERRSSEWKTEMGRNICNHDGKDNDTDDFQEYKKDGDADRNDGNADDNNNENDNSVENNDSGNNNGNDKDDNDHDRDRDRDRDHDHDHDHDNDNDNHDDNEKKNKVADLEEETDEDVSQSKSTTGSVQSCIGCGKSTKELKMFIFARADREKEDWYRRLVSATTFVRRRDRSVSTMRCDAASVSAAYSSSIAHEVHAGENTLRSNVATSLFCFDVSPELNYNTYMRRCLEASSSHQAEGDSSVAWINCLVGRLLYDVHRHPETINLIQDRIQRKLSNIKLPYFMESLSVSEVAIGQGTPPLLQSVAKPVVDERGLWIDLDVIYKGCVTMTVETKLNLMKLTRKGSSTSNELGSNIDGSEKPKDSSTRSPMFDSDVEDSPETSTEDDDASTNAKSGRGAGTAKEITSSTQSSGKKFLSMVDRLAANKYFRHATELSYVRRAMEGVSNTEIRLMVSVSEIEGCLSLNVPPSPSDRLWYGFKPVPKVTLTVKPAVGERTVNIVYVTKWIETRLLREFEKLVVLPNMDDLVLPLCPNYPYLATL